jgi:hypothetical protein
MGLETGTYISDLVATNPTATDGMKEGDDHFRLMKSVIQASFPNITGAMTATHTKLNNGAVPTGTICLWYSTSGTIPTGWTYCNGSAVAREDGGGNITPPDLRDKFVVCAGTTYSQGTTGGSTTSDSQGAHTHTFTSDAGGDHTHGGTTGSHTLTTAEIPNHGHPWRHSTASAGAPDGTGGIALFLNGAVSKAAFSGTVSSTVGETIGGTGGGGGHTHTISASGTHTHTGTTASNGAHTHTVTPPYYALVYMMRK